MVELNEIKRTLVEYLQICRKSQLAVPGKRRDVMDVIRTAYWYYGVLSRSGRTSAYGMEKLFEPPESFRKSDAGQQQHRNKWQRYARGAHTPGTELVKRVDNQFPGSATELNHVLWETLRPQAILPAEGDSLLRRLGPDVQMMIFDFDRSGVGASYWRRKANGRLLGRLERRASIDSLACLTVLFREAAALRERSFAFEIANRIYRVLLMLGIELAERRVARELFNVYVERVFPLAGWQNRRFCFSEFNYLPAALRLNALVYETKETKGKSLSWQERVPMMVKLLEGDFGFDVKFALMPTLVFDPTVGPADDDAEDHIEFQRRARVWGWDCLRNGRIGKFPPTEVWTG